MNCRLRKEAKYNVETAPVPLPEPAPCAGAFRSRVAATAPWLAACRQRLVLLSIACLAACTTPALNSDRIAERYGSYSVRVLFQDDSARLASLESLHPEGPVTRTLALTQFVAPRPAVLEAPHARIAGGGSIGATFREAGFTIRKEPVCLDDVSLDRGEAARGLRIDLPAVVAVHAYRFVVRRDGREFDYATIVEMHHPDYLQREDLQKLYRLPPASCRSLRAAISRHVPLQ